MADTNTIVLSPELMAFLELYAQTANKTVEAVTDDALRFYLDGDPDFNALRREHLDRAIALGLRPEEYIAKLIREDRAERRALVA